MSNQRRSVTVVVVVVVVTVVRAARRRVRMSISHVVGMTNNGVSTNPRSVFSQINAM